jgi:hypothetical protein
VKFHDGAWATLLATGALVAIAFAVKKHYQGVSQQLRHLDAIVDASQQPNAADRIAGPQISPAPQPADRVTFPKLDPNARTAVVLVNGYNGLGLHTVLHIPRMFGDTFRNLVFLSVGAVDAGNFKGEAELKSLRDHTEAEAARYIAWAKTRGYGATAFTAIGHDITEDVMQLARQANSRFPNAVFFAGQLLFSHETRFTRLLHNSTAFALQRRFFLANLPFAILPIRVGIESRS